MQNYRKIRLTIVLIVAPPPLSPAQTLPSSLVRLSDHPLQPPPFNPTPHPKSLPLSNVSHHKNYKLAGRKAFVTTVTKNTLSATVANMPSISLSPATIPLPAPPTYPLNSSQNPNPITHPNHPPKLKLTQLK
jgi:hypothetical protein